MPVFVDNQSGGRTKVSYGTKGAINEHLAMAWLMKNGYDVFKNVAPVGRADLVAKNWKTGELVWVDVKSQSYDPDHCNGVTEASKRASKQAERYRDSNIKYLIVDDDGYCHWYGDDGRMSPTKNDKYWLDPKSGQRFLHPRNTYSQKDWSIFSHYMLKYHRDELSQEQIDLLYNVNRSTTGRGRHLSRLEIESLPAVRDFLYNKIAVEPANDNEAATNAA